MTDPEADVHGVSIVIPAWNEEDRLARTLERYIGSLETQGDPFEIIVVVDGVSDRTAEVAERFVSSHVRVLNFPMKLGKGGAVLAGVQASRFQFVGYIDADGPIEGSDIIALVSGLSNSDCVVGSRWIDGSHVVAPEPRLRRMASKIWGSLVRSTLFLPIHDTQCGAKFFRRTAVLPVLREVVVTNWAFDVSLLYHLGRNGCSLKEQPVTWSHDSRSRMVVARAIPIMFLSLVGLRLMNLSVARHIPPSWVDQLVLKFSSA